MEIKKIILDSNIYDKLVELDIDEKIFNQFGFEILNTKITENELNNISDESKKEQLQNKYNHISNSKVGFFGFGDNSNSLGFGKGMFLDKFKDEVIAQGRTKKNRIDREIISLCRDYNAIFVSCDVNALNFAKRMNIKVIDFKKIKNIQDLEDVFYGLSDDEIKISEDNHAK